MTTQQTRLITFLESSVAHLHFYGHEQLAWKTGQIVDALHKGETVWAVILADAFGLGAAFIERLRGAFDVKQI